jgi:hypothetical protein
MKRIIRLSESDLVRIVKQVLKEQGPIGTVSRINLTKPTPSFSGRPPRVELDGGDIGCEYTPEEKVRCFFQDAKTWTGGVDEKYMNDIIEKMKSSLSSLTGDFEFLRLFGLIKSKAGMGYLVKNFKMNNKNLFVILSEDNTISWVQILFVLKNNFSDQLKNCYGPSGCGGRL